MIFISDNLCNLSVGLIINIGSYFAGFFHRLFFAGHGSVFQDTKSKFHGGIMFHAQCNTVLLKKLVETRYFKIQRRLCGTFSGLVWIPDLFSCDIVDDTNLWNNTMLSDVDS